MIKSLSVFAAVFVFFYSVVSADDLPGINKMEGTEVSPDQAFNYYLSASSSCNISYCQRYMGASSQVKELAVNLGANRLSDGEYKKNVFEYVYLNIETLPMFGLKHGALGAVIDKKGTAFDQAHLMVELLKQDDTIAGTIKYVIGDLTIPQNEAANWLGVTYKNTGIEQYNTPALEALLKNGGIPYLISGSNVTVLHVWVKVGGEVYDPSYKKNEYIEGVDIETATGCSSACAADLSGAALTSAQSGTLSGNVNYFSNINTTALANRLNVYARNFQDYIDDNVIHKPADLALSGQYIKESSLPNRTYLLATRISRLETSAIPDSYRATWLLSIDAMQVAFYADEIYGKNVRITGKELEYSLTTVNGIQTKVITKRAIGIYVGLDQISKNINNNPSHTNDVLLYQVNQPYAGPVLNGVAQGTYLDVSNAINSPIHSQVLVNNVPNESIGHVALKLFVSDVDQGTLNNVKNINVMEELNPDFEDPETAFNQLICSTNIKCYVELFALNRPTLATDWALQAKKVKNLIEGFSNTKSVDHHSFVMTGVMAGNDIISVDTRHGFVSKDGNSSNELTAFKTYAHIASRLEGSLFEQQGNKWEGGSAISYFEKANRKGRKFFDVNSVNLNNVFSNTSGYSSAQISELKSFVKHKGQRLIISNHGDVGNFDFQVGSVNILGTPIYSYSIDETEQSHMLGTAFKGGVSNGVDKVKIAESIKHKEFSLGEGQLVKPDVKTGNFSINSQTDIVTGSGDFPYSLDFKRSYNSKNYSGVRSRLSNNAPTGEFGVWIHYTLLGTKQDTFLASGWTHNYGIQAAISSDPYQYLGADNVKDASFALASLYGTFQLLKSSSFDQKLTAIFTSDWFGDQIIDNTVNISGQLSGGVFTRLPDGKFNAPNGSNASIIINGNKQGPWAMSNQGKIEYNYGPVSIDYYDESLNKMTFIPSRVVNVAGDGAQPYYAPIFVPEKWTFKSGAIVNFTYETFSHPASNYEEKKLISVSNNLGRSLTFEYASSSDNGCTLSTINEPQCFDVYLDSAFTSDGIYVLRAVKDETGRKVQYGRSWQSANVGNEVIQKAVLNSHFEVIYPDNSISIFEYEGGILTSRENIIPKLNKVVLPGHSSAQPSMKIIYNTQAKAEKFINARSKVSYLYVAEGHRTEAIDSLGNRQIFAYGIRGNLIKYVDQKGRVFSYDYDDFNRIIKETYPEGNGKELSYDKWSNIISVRHFSKPSCSESCEDKLEKFYFENNSFKKYVTKIIDAESVKNNPSLESSKFWKEVKYDSRGRITEILEPADLNNIRPKTQYSYTGCSNNYSKPCLETDPEGMVTKHNYDTSGNLISTIVDYGTGRKNLKTVFFYDKIGNLCRTVDPRGSSGLTGGYDASCDQ